MNFISGLLEVFFELGDAKFNCSTLVSDFLWAIPSRKLKAARFFFALLARAQ
jgi:hypothetical protein